MTTRLRRAALSLICVLCACGAANPEVKHASDAGARYLGCDPSSAQVTLEKDNGTWRVYLVACEMELVRIQCFDPQPCQPEDRAPDQRLDPIL